LFRRLYIALDIDSDDLSGVRAMGLLLRLTSRSQSVSL
jgi:hypothetical protein